MLNIASPINFGIQSRLIKIILILILALPLSANQNWFKSRTAKDQFEKAVVHYNSGRYAITESILKKVLERDAGNFDASCRFLLMKAIYGLNRTEDSRDIARFLLKTYPASRYKKDIFLCLGDMFIDEGKYGAAFRMYLNARDEKSDLIFIDRVNQRILKTLVLNIPPQEIDELLASVYEDSKRSILLLTKAYGDIYNGRFENAFFVLNQINPDELPEVFWDLYEQLLLVSRQPQQKTVTVGVVLPLSGKYESWGTSFLQGLEIAIQANAIHKINISIIIHDNRSREIGTIQAIRKLIKNQNVMAIVGPLETKNALLAANSVYESDVPLLIPLSVQDGLNTLSENVYQLNSNLQIRGKLAAQYAVQELKLENLAVLAPSTETGQNLVDSFIHELDQLGKTPIAVEWYSGIPMDLSRQFKSLRKVAWDLKPKDNVYDEFLGMEIDSLDALFEISGEDFFNLPDKEKETISPSDSSKIILESIDGLYMPISEPDLSYLGNQFPMYNLKTLIIGNDAWLNLNVLNQENIGPHINKMILLTNQTESGMKWIKSEPTELKNRQLFFSGIDCAQLLVTVLESSTLNRKAIRNRLSSIDEFHGTSHIFSFDARIRNLNTALQVVQYDQFKFNNLGYFKGDSLIHHFADAP